MYNTDAHKLFNVMILCLVSRISSVKVLVKIAISVKFCGSTT